MLVAIPQQNDATVNTVIAMTKTFFRPSMSLSFPASGIIISWPSA